MEQNRKKVYSKKVKWQKLNKAVQECSEFKDSPSTPPINISSSDSDNNLNNSDDLDISDSNIFCNNSEDDEFDVFSMDSDCSSTSSDTTYMEEYFMFENEELREIEELQEWAVSRCVPRDGSEGDFVYYGIHNQLQKSVKVHLHDTDMLELLINIDGISPFKSSAVTM